TSVLLHPFPTRRSSDLYNTISGDSLLAESGKDLFENIEPPKGPGKKWEIEDALKTIEEGEGARDYGRGKSLFAAVRCASCHTMQDRKSTRLNSSHVKIS